MELDIKYMIIGVAKDPSEFKHLCWITLIKNYPYLEKFFKNHNSETHDYTIYKYNKDTVERMLNPNIGGNFNFIVYSHGSEEEREKINSMLNIHEDYLKQLD